MSNVTDRSIFGHAWYMGSLWSGTHAGRPSNAHARAKELSAVMRAGAVLLAILVVNSPRK
jgi:hypothetical protein